MDKPLLLNTVNIITILSYLEKGGTKPSNYIYLILCYLNRDQHTNEIDTIEINKLFNSLGNTKQKTFQVNQTLYRQGLMIAIGYHKRLITTKGLNKAREIIKGYRKQVKDLPKPPKGLKINF